MPLASVLARTVPSTVIEPPSMVSNWPKQRKNVDLPDPDGPIIETISPLFILSDTSRNTV